MEGEPRGNFLPTRTQALFPKTYWWFSKSYWAALLRAQQGQLAMRHPCLLQNPTKVDEQYYVAIRPVPPEPGWSVVLWGTQTDTNYSSAVTCRYSGSHSDTVMKFKIKECWHGLTDFCPPKAPAIITVCTAHTCFGATSLMAKWSADCAAHKWLGFVPVQFTWLSDVPWNAGRLALHSSKYTLLVCWRVCKGLLGF